MNKIIWLTGQSGAGKTTLAKGISKKLGYLILDGDEMRESISFGLTYSKLDRAKNNLRIARLIKQLSKQTDIIVSVIAPMKKVRKEITKICNPKWVYIKRDLPKKKGYFYEESNNHSTIDVDKGSYEDNLNLLIKIIKNDIKMITPYSEEVNK